MASTAGAITGMAAVAAYLDAKYHIRADLQRGALESTSPEAMRFIQQRVEQDRMMLYHDIQHWAELDQPSHLFLEYDGRSWTYKEFYQALQRVGNWLMSELGIERHEMVAVNGPNSAEYLMLWFAVDGIGACESFINYNLTGTALTHSIQLCKPRYVLADKSTAERLEPCRDVLTKTGIKIVYFDEQLFAGLKDNRAIPKARTAGCGPEDIRSLIYTSGTTGLPKGVMITTGRQINTARAMAKTLKLRQTDKFYTCLPLYHGAAQGLCTTPVIHAGASMCLAKKFSHATFWPDVHSSGATHMQYVGELCRYLVNAPVHPLERKHRVRMAWGNGMRPDVWERFRQRFGIPIIHELYAATDGMGSTFNWNRGGFSRGAIGVRGALWHWYKGGGEVRARIDPDTEEIMRGQDGWVEKCGVNEPGEVLYRVDPAMSKKAFRGYFGNDAASNKRWLRDVFASGDLWFRSGDVHRQDVDGRVFFVDRLGDTFRWKSENVSTNEVADVLGQFPQIAEANVYGVTVPNADGRCGCAMVVLRDGLSRNAFDSVGLAQYLLERLPRYAIPVFIRVTPSLSYTSNFKMQKGQAKRDGVDLDVIEKSGSKDYILWLPPGAIAYGPYRSQDWDALKVGRVNL